MKKSIAILFLFIYLTPTLGVTVSWSKCNKSNMKANNIIKCVCKPGKPNKKCCDNKKYTFKLKDNQQKTEVITPKLVSFFVMPSTPAFQIDAKYSFSEVKLTSTHLPRPPNLYQHPIYLLNQVFLI
ncbi:MAG: hypothetical protein ABIQ27_10625 [Flavobacterium sp.]|uniref:hypothetical protein n=1 Tax=Flavobacterium sp. TaxID=239 RepID=UPI003264430B